MVFVAMAWAILGWAARANAVILWSDLDATLVHETGLGSDILGGAVKRDDLSNDTLYFKFHVNPRSDQSTEAYFAALELFEGDAERLGLGNALNAWAYSAYLNTDANSETNKVAGYIDLHSNRPEPSVGGALVTYQLPRRGEENTIVFKVQYVVGGDDLVTVWMNPDLGPGATEVYQPEGLTTRFSANASFDEIRLRHGGGGEGWTFDNIAVATSFRDFVDASSAKPGEETPSAIDGTRSLNFRSWQREQGLPQNFVRALAQTRDGYIWVGTDDGVARFDGLRFVAFGAREGLRSGPVSALFGDSHGALWVGSVGNGLSRLQHDQITTFTAQSGLPSGVITALAEDRKGQLWIGTSAGLVVWQNGQLSPLSAAGEFKGQPIAMLFNDRQGNMWLGAKGAGVFQFLGDKFVPLTETSLAGLLKDPHCLWVDQSGRIWIGAGDDFVVCRDGDRWQRYRIPRHLAKPYVNALAEEADGTVWAGSVGGGLLQFREGKLAAITASSGLSGTLVEALMVDREGILWVGTDAGLNRLRRKSLFALGQSDGLGYGAVHGLAEVAAGVIWASKPGDGLYRWDGRSFNRLTAAGLSPRDSQVNTLLVTRDGSCWVAGANGLLRYKDPRAAADEVKVFELPRQNITSLTEDRSGGLWVGTREGRIWQLREGKWLPQTNFSQPHPVTAMVPDPDGSIWIGTKGSGLYRFKGGLFNPVEDARGRLTNLIRTLHLDAQGTLWIGTAGGGLSRWRDGHITTFTTREGLPDNTISQILEDAVGRLWLGSSRGIACVNKSRLDELAAGKIPLVLPQVYGRAEGMLSEECTGGFSPTGLKTRSSRLWFSTLKGIVVVDPRTQKTNAPMPTVVLEEILVDGVPNPEFRGQKSAVRAQNGNPGTGESELEMLRINPGRHRIELRYTGLSFDGPELMRFRYRLEGLDADWVEVGTRRAAFYNYVPPGVYRFLVNACNADGVWTETGNGFALTVLRHFWQTWWFIGLAGLGLLVSVGGAVRVVEKRKIQQRLEHLEQERALERERTRIAQDLHDEMGAKLCRISFLSEHARRCDLKPAELQDQINSISDASREVLHSLDEIVWAVNPRNDTLEHVASYIGQYAHEYFQMTGIECELDIPAQLPPHPLSSQMRHHLFLAVHEALTNILKHSNASRAKVSMTCTASAFEITAADNGKGFNPSATESKAELPAGAAGDGLRNMHRRMADIGGHCQVDFVPGQGTTIRFVLPLNPSVSEV